MTTYANEPYRSISPPIADNESLMEQGDRVMLYHKRTGSQMYIAQLGIAEKGEMHAGWVIGIINH